MHRRVSCKEPDIRDPHAVGISGHRAVSDPEEVAKAAHCRSDVVLPKLYQKIRPDFPKARFDLKHQPVCGVLNASDIHAGVPVRRILIVLKEVDEVELQAVQAIALNGNRIECGKILPDLRIPGIQDACLFLRAPVQKPPLKHLKGRGFFSDRCHVEPDNALHAKRMDF